MSKREECIDRITAVAQEYAVTAVGLDLLEERLRADSSFLKRFKLGSRDARNCRDRLEATYLIRVYAEFESGLRDAWRHFFRRDTYPPMKDLLVAIAARRRISQDWLDRTDAVRRYRNSLVHEEAEASVAVTLSESQLHLCQFFSRLPHDW